MKIYIPIARFKAAIFDMDGTMINNADHHKKAWQEFLKQYNIFLTDEEFRQTISGKKNNQILESLFGKKLDDSEIKRYADEKEALYRGLFKPDIKEIAGLTKAIDKLHEMGLRTAIATTAPIDNRDFALKELNLEGRFEIILGDEHVDNGKPHPEIYTKTAQRLGVQPNDCVVFEDSPPGVASGKAANMTVVGILSSHTADELNGADFLVNDYIDITFSPN